ncbi:MAG: Jag N-terminal domain-containing protein [Oscillospiraceae bacterium]|nr:Jag N-terminal domain-containing protein [Oscillospiraceae bacterium]
MSYIDVTGKTTEEAIANALAQLGMSRDDVSVEILAQAKSGFLGLGASPAKVRVTYGPDEATMDDVVLPTFEKPVKKEAAPKKAAQPQPKKEEPKKPAEKKPEPKKQEPKKAEPAEKRDGAPVKAAAENLPLCEDKNAQRITAFLTGLLAHLESDAQVKVYEMEKGRYKVILDGDKLGQLIGRRGETLDAIQQLTNYALNDKGEKRIRVQVDAENYRAKREASLESLALKVAAKVTRYRRSVTLEPMNAYERHVIHSALQDTAGVTTYSIGTEPNRRVVVAYDRESR